MIDLVRRPPESSERVPCTSKLALGPSLVTHLFRLHNIRHDEGRAMVEVYRKNLPKIASKDTTVDLWTSL